MLRIQRFLAGAALIATVPFAPASYGYGFPCPPVESLIYMTDGIIVGNTLEVERQETRPTQFQLTYVFQVSHVLLGDTHEVGEVARVTDKMLGYEMPASFPFDGTGAHLVFVQRTDDEKLIYFCTTPIGSEDATFVKRQIKILEDPIRFMSSKDPVDIRIVIGWLGRAMNQDKPGHHLPQSRWIPMAPPDRDKALTYLRRHMHSSNDDLAIAVLEVFKTLNSRDAYNDYIKLLGRDDNALMSIAAEGLAHLDDSAALPHLIDRYEELWEQEQENLRLERRGHTVQRRPYRDRGRGHMPFPYRSEQTIFGAIQSFVDPAVDSFNRKLKIENRLPRTTEIFAVELASDSVERLLERFWAGEVSIAKRLTELDDPIILEQARERKYDHPLAPHLLAATGDPKSREFMIRLLQQGHWAGARWAEVAMDESAKGDLIRSFFTYRDSRPEVGHAGVALGRMRAFEVFSIMSEWDLANWDSIGPASHFLLGLVDASNAGPSECKGKEPWDCFRRLIREKAREEAWSADDLASTIALTKVIEHPRFVQPPQLRQSWEPPAALRGMPDPLDKEKTTKFIRLHPDKFLDILEDGDLEDKIKVLMVLSHCEALDLVDPVLAVRLMGAPHYSIHNLVGRAIADGGIALSPVQLEYCARCIGWAATNRTLNWMRTHPRLEYRPILRKVLLDGRHLFQRNLYIAITENEAVQCADVLRSFLETEHYAIRFNAAITLFSLGDDSVLPLLRELMKTRRSASSCLSGVWTETVMAALE